MKVGAVAAFRITGPDRISPTPSRAALVITELRGDVLVDGVRLLAIGGCATRGLARHLGDFALEGHQAIGLAVALEQSWVGRPRSGGRMLARTVHLLAPYHVERHRQCETVGGRRYSFEV